MDDASLVVHVPDAIVTGLVSATSPQRKLAATIACKFASGRVVIEHPVVEQALALLETNGDLPNSVLAELRSLAEALEAHYLAISERSSGDHGRTEAEAFAQARLAACLLDAVQADSIEGATSAIYEAIAASGNEQGVCDAVYRVLTRW
jgi:hypothetical protein